MPSRGDQARKRIIPLIDQLIKNLDSTDLSKGASSQANKLEIAQEAIDTWWQVSSILVSWAHNHIIGYEMARESLEFRELLIEAFQLETLNVDSHALEIIGRAQNWEYISHDDETENEIEKTLDLLCDVHDLKVTDSALRRAIGKIFYSKDHVMSVTRRRLMDDIMEVEHGGKVNLFTPAKTRKVVKPLMYDRTRGMIIAHIHFRIGKGIKKYIALEQVAREVPYAIETLRSWEKELSGFDWIKFWWQSAWMAGAYEIYFQDDFDEDPLVIDSLVDHIEQWGNNSNIEFAREFYNNHASGFYSLENLSKDLKRHSKKMVAKN